jgi:hypothetical protein
LFPLRDKKINSFFLLWVRLFIHPLPHFVVREGYAAHCAADDRLEACHPDRAKRQAGDEGSTPSDACLPCRFQANRFALIPRQKNAAGRDDRKGFLINFSRYV